MSFIVIVPARAASTRLPGKQLLDVGGLPMVVRTARQAARSAAARILIATDHADIARAAAEHGVEALMTRPDHPTGTDRLSEVATALGLDDDDVVVNVQ
ncbi:MAG: 3-deoxy-manno-octulosonate cytidylyltransferase, partial [Castellaniella sp.]